MYDEKQRKREKKLNCWRFIELKTRVQHRDGINVSIYSYLMCVVVQLSKQFKTISFINIELEENK